MARTFVKTFFCSFLHVFGYLGQIIFMVITKKNQSIHDIAAKTIAIQGQAPLGAQLGYWRLAVSLLGPGVAVLAVFTWIH